MLRLFMIAVLSVAVLSLAACGGGQNGQQSDAPPGGTGKGEPTEPPEEASEEAAPGDDEPRPGTEQAGPGEEFSVTTLQGEEFDLSGERDEVVALYFMAGW